MIACYEILGAVAAGSLAVAMGCGLAVFVRWWLG